MKKRMVFLVALALIMSLALSVFGEADSAATVVKNSAAATMTGGAFPIEVKVDVSSGLSVVFYDDGFSLFEGEYDASTYPLVTATILSEEVYEDYLARNKDSDTFREDFGFYKYTSSIGELCCLYKIGDKVPFMLSFDKSVDGDKADKIIKCLEFNY